MKPDLQPLSFKRRERRRLCRAGSKRNPVLAWPALRWSYPDQYKAARAERTNQ
jgi:hypothetical protein